MYCNVVDLSSSRCGLWNDGGLYLHWNLLQCGDLHRILLLLHVNDKPAALDVL